MTISVELQRKVEELTPAELMTLEELLDAKDNMVQMFEILIIQPIDSLKKIKNILKLYRERDLT